jgi:hypothetical protein
MTGAGFFGAGFRFATAWCFGAAFFAFFLAAGFRFAAFISFFLRAGAAFFFFADFFFDFAFFAMIASRSVYWIEVEPRLAIRELSDRSTAGHGPPVAQSINSIV